MKLIFVGGRTTTDLIVLKETKKFLTFKVNGGYASGFIYRYNKDTKEVQVLSTRGPRTIEGMKLEF